MIDEDLIGGNIFRAVKPPKVKDFDTRGLSLDEAGAFFNAARGSKFEAFFQIAVLTGARRGELAALKWSAVDLDSSALTIRASFASTRAKKVECLTGAASVVVKTPKSGRSRQVPLDPDALAVLRRLKAEQAAQKLAARPGTYMDEGFVFCDVHGRPFKLDATTKAFRDVADAAVLPAEVTLHSLRHTFASWSLANGGDIIAVKRCLGHAAASTTMNLNVHVVDGGREKAVAATGGAPRRAQGGNAAAGGK